MSTVHKPIFGIKKPEHDFTPHQDFIRHMMSCTRKGCTTCEGK